MDSTSSPGSSKKSVNTLDLIEECLNMVHTSRKAYALSNSRKLKEQQRKMRGVYSAKYDKPSDFAIHDDDDDEPLQKRIDPRRNDEDDLKLLEEMANSFSSPPVQPAPYEKPPDAADVNAQTVMDIFCEELQEFVKKSPNVNDDEARADYADYLIDKYLAQSLDKYEKSAAISRIRKSISYSIERFCLTGLFEAPTGAKKSPKKSSHDGRDHQASTGTASQPSPSNSSPFSRSHLSHQEKESVNKSTTGIASPRKSHQNSSSSSSSGGQPTVAGSAGTASNSTTSQPAGVDSNDRKPRVPMTAEEKSKLEKQKIKEQYEAFLNLKKKTENHPDVQSINQYTHLNDDIASLISSIKGGGGK